MKKKVVAINAWSFGSTGNIMRGVINVAAENGYESVAFVSERAKSAYKNVTVENINSRLGAKLAINLSKLTGLEGCFAIFSTLKLVRKIRKFNPDIIHLHNLHSGYINLPILTRFIKKSRIPVVWTLHDCWAFTGHCPHFAYEKCEKWKTGCFDCPRYRSYPKSIFDNSKFMWKWKKKWFSNFPNLTIVTPSQWLCDLLSESYLKDYKRQVIYNGIDLEVFHPIESTFAKDNDLEDKKIVLGVSSVWSDRKGLDVFIELSKRLSDDYAIVLVGTDDNIDKTLPDRVISIHRTENAKKLAEIYSAADVFVNPTREDTFPTVNIEALACGAPVITFKTGGSPESLSKKCGIVVDCNNIDMMEEGIVRICTEKPYSKDACVKRAQEYEKQQRFYDYIKLYK